jgi:threonine/homoserine efflux transporter RhtA
MSYTAPKNIKLYVIIQNIPLGISTALDLTLLLMVARIFSIYVFGIHFCSFKLFLFPILAVLKSQIFQVIP